MSREYEVTIEYDDDETEDVCIIEDDSDDESEKRKNFMRADLDKRQKELETFLKLLKVPEFIFRKVQLLTMDDVAINIMRRNSDSKKEFLKWLVITDHQVNGEMNCWSNGFLGSRWADVEIMGKTLRIAFYTRSGDPEFTDWDMFRGRDYILEMYELGSVWS
jgi:hypothetical protein